MIRIIAQRAPADRTGPDISDPLITSAAAAVERGRNEIDRNGSPRLIDTRTTVLRVDLQPGMLVEVSDADGSVWRGQLQAVSHRAQAGDQPVLESVLTIERVAP